ncbi:hypothetical protein AVEN_111837-1 [Araneus ventricosus]|uniref:Uncharacterized protein n=1 Tax=Araneus ventricosus TaxID=182803 RepID=A0A4Y2BYX7_ARAVE|nr:hypothetical protein AVEN_111837-1 [Araneus ventricosus]
MLQSITKEASYCVSIPETDEKNILTGLIIFYHYYTNIGRNTMFEGFHNLINFIMSPCWASTPKNIWRPRWPSSKVPTPGPEGRRLETRFHRRSAVYGARCALNHTQWQRPPAGVARKLGEVGASPGVVLVI